jgi:hypothetical protein
LLLQVADKGRRFSSFDVQEKGVLTTVLIRTMELLVMLWKNTEDRLTGEQKVGGGGG